VPGLISLLNTSDLDVKIKAAEALGLIGYERAVDNLVGLLDDPEQGVREATSKALAKIGGKAIDELFSFLKSGDYKLEALKALEANLDGKHIEELLEVLVGLLNERDEYIRYETVVNLGKVGEKGIKHLIEALDDESALVRRGAAMALILNRETSLRYLERELEVISPNIEKARLIQDIIKKIKQ